MIESGAVPASIGTFCTAVLHTRDTAAAARFYNEIFGWTFEDDRFMLRGKRAAASVYDRAFDRWVPYFAAETVRRGELSLHSDPEGAVFGTCTPDDPREVTLTQGPGSVWWVEVLSHDTDALKVFYRDIFDWTYVDRAPFDPHPLYIFCMRGDQQATGILPIGPGWDQPARWQVLFEVESLAQSSAAVLAAGGSHHFGPLEVTGICALTSFFDPQGALFFLVQPHRQA